MAWTEQIGPQSWRVRYLTGDGTPAPWPRRRRPVFTKDELDPLPQTVAQRDCPHCGGPITIVALLTTPEAERPQMPIAAPDGVIPLRR